MTTGYIAAWVEVRGESEEERARTARRLLDETMGDGRGDLVWFVLPNHQQELGHPELDDGNRLVWEELPGEWPNR